MAIRVMSFNINRFNDATLDRTEYNPWYILEAVTGQQLDIFVVIEVQTNNGLLGALISGNGAIGVQTLLAMIQEEDAAGDWRLVPPPVLNDNVLGPTYTEGIAVFYRNATLTFTGPYYFNGAGVMAVPGATATAYAGGWANALPGGNNRAPQISFTDYFGGPINFPDAGNRPPMLTTFTENANGRTVRLLSVHFPPNNAKAADALVSVGKIQAFISALGAPDVAIAIGDFNYDPTKEKSVLGVSRYNGFTSSYHFKGFTQANGPTRIEKSSLADLTLTNNGLHRYQEVKPPKGNIRPNYLDNAYIRYGSGGAPIGAVYNPTVVDMVAGVGAYATSMSQSIASITTQIYYNQTDLFRESQNYGHIAHQAGVSDHLPIVIDVP